MARRKHNQHGKIASCHSGQGVIISSLLFAILAIMNIRQLTQMTCHPLPT